MASRSYSCCSRPDRAFSACIDTAESTNALICCELHLCILASTSSLPLGSSSVWGKLAAGVARDWSAQLFQRALQTLSSFEETRSFAAG